MVRIDFVNLILRYNESTHIIPLFQPEQLLKDHPHEQWARQKWLGYRLPSTWQPYPITDDRLGEEIKSCVHDLSPILRVEMFSHGC